MFWSAKFSGRLSKSKNYNPLCILKDLTDLVTASSLTRRYKCDSSQISVNGVRIDDSLQNCIHLCGVEMHPYVWGKQYVGSVLTTEEKLHIIKTTLALKAYFVKRKELAVGRII